MPEINNIDMPIISQVLVDKNYTIRTFCDVVGITTPTYYNYLRNKTRVPTEVLSKMKAILGLDIPVIAQKNMKYCQNMVAPRINIVKSVV